jgi:hypothetical protein
MSAGGHAVSSDGPTLGLHRQPGLIWYVLQKLSVDIYQYESEGLFDLSIQLPFAAQGHPAMLYSSCQYLLHTHAALSGSGIDLGPMD